MTRDGSYDVRLRFSARDEAGQAELRIAGTIAIENMAPGDQTCRFEGVPLKRGDARLEAVLTYDDETHGAHQVEVHLR